MANNSNKTVTIQVKTLGVSEAVANMGELQNLAKGISAKPFKLTIDTKDVEAKLLKIQAEAGKVVSTYDLGAGKTLVRTTQEVDGAFQHFDKVIYDAKKHTKELADAEKQAAAQTQNVGKSAKTAADGVKNLTNFYQRFSFLVQRYIITKALNAFGNAMRDALGEMKNVDTELITIQKVTGATKDEIDRLTQSAYEVAAALGTTASEYLNAVGEFSKAGYGAQAEQLGELAIMAANVGDTTQETANQFLLATDKAYQFNGSVEELTRVLDGANEIGNRFATDVEHIASGLGTVAPIAAQAHVGVNELTSAIGTITAVTQRSGTEAARALRALFLNIMGDTKTEIEDGVTWTKEEINSLRDVLRKYAPEAVKAADATGTLVDPMEAIGGLAKAFESGLINEQKLMAMVSDIGGKLRSSQLLALIQNWDMYQQMMETYATSAGSAAQEYSIYLNSWEAKTKQLTAAWTNFVQHFINTDAIKGMLDLLRGFIGVLDTFGGRLAVAALAVGAFTHALTVLLATAKGGVIGAFFKNAVDAIRLFVAALASGEGAIAGFSVAWATSPFAVAAAAAAGIYAIAKGIQYFNERGERAKQLVEETTSRISELRSEYETLADKYQKGEATEAEARRLSILEAELKVQQDLLKLQQVDAYEKSQGKLRRELPDLINQYNELNAVVTKNAQLDAENRAAKANLINEITRYIDDLDAAKEAGIRLEATDQALYDMAMRLINGYAGEQKAVENLVGADKLMETEGGRAARSYAAQVISAQSDIKDAINMTTTAMRTQLLAMMAANSAYTSSQSPLGEATAQMFKGKSITTKEGYKFSLDKGITDGIHTGVIDVRTPQQKAAYEQAEQALKKLDAAIASAGKVDTGDSPSEPTGPTGGGGSSRSSQKKEDEKDKYLESLKAIVSLRKSELDLLEKQNAPVSQQVAKIKEIQNSLHSQAEYLRKTKGSQEEINKLSSEWLQYQQQIVKLQEQLKDNLDDAIKNKLSEAEKQMQAQVDAIQKEIDALEAARDVQEDALELEEKQNAVIEKRIALQNALNERTVRYYNAATGMWEWGANASNVKSAEEALAEAEKDLADYQEEQRHDARVAELERQQERLKDDYKYLEETWEAIAKSMEKPTTDIVDDLKDLAENGTPEMKRQVDNIIEIFRRLGIALGAEEEAQIRKAASNSDDGGGASNQVYSVGGSGKNFVYNTQSGNISVNGRVVKPGDAGYAATKAAMEADTGKKFDRGGVLSGIGGIKATAFDEMIVPPDITGSMLDPTASSTFRKRMAELRFLYGSAQSIPASLAGTVDNRIGSQHNGDIYQMGGISISEQQARGMTVYELAQLSRNLKLANNR